MFKQVPKDKPTPKSSKNVVVLEIGAFSTKLGYAGMDKPSLIDPTVRAERLLEGERCVPG